MSYSVEICDAIMDFLREDNWKFRFDEEREIIITGISLKSKLKKADVVIDLRDDKYLVYLISPLDVGEPERPEMRSLLNRINYSLSYGCFVMDEEDGEVRFRYSVNCCDQIPSKAVIRHSLYFPAMAMNKYGDAIVQVLMACGTGEEAYGHIG